ncbi:hypothetical protein NQ314_012137 [Rhamnusium bicolor]|uniref:Uncharacterized protein n=1 Tax=Rhamnusium bicolor TaxID=1586634 RepID=A0AAV8XFR2_9CUCU|nr:hypothetical protein NQ314_012137 [Rhamnusium bicolor]
MNSYHPLDAKPVGTILEPTPSTSAAEIMDVHIPSIEIPRMDTTILVSAEEDSLSKMKLKRQNRTLFKTNLQKSSSS